MKSQFEQALLQNYGRDTVVHAAAHATERPQAREVKREIVAGSGPHLSKETVPLLRLRLRAAALILLIGFAAFLAWHLIGIVAGEPLDLSLLVCHCLVTAVLGLSFLVLLQVKSLSMPNLRWAELIVFGLPTAFFLLLQRRSTLLDAERGFMSPPMAFWLLLIFTYAMFIPSTWRRAVLVIGAMAMAPTLRLTALMLAYPQGAAVIAVIDFLQHVLWMVVGAIAAVFGTQIINSLRREAFAARQLGQYRLLSRLGAGGMGEVFLAEHCMLKRPCAIKMIRPEQAGDAGAGSLRTRSSHYCLADALEYRRVFDYGAPRTAPSLCDGVFARLELEELLEPRSLAAARVIHLLRQACQGLQEATRLA